MKSNHETALLFQYFIATCYHILPLNLGKHGSIDLNVLVEVYHIYSSAPPLSAKLSPNDLKFSQHMHVVGFDKISKNEIIQ